MSSSLPVLSSLSSRPTQLKALSGGLVCDSRKTPPPGLENIKEEGGGWFGGGSHLGQEGCENGLNRAAFFLYRSQQMSGYLCFYLRFSFWTWMLRWSGQPGARCWDADERPSPLDSLLCRECSLIPKPLKEDKSGGKNWGFATGQLDLVCGKQDYRPVVWDGAPACSERRARRAAAAGAMKAPRRPRQTLLLPRLCVCGVGLVAAAWIFHFNDVTGACRKICCLKLPWFHFSRVFSNLNCI